MPQYPESEEVESGSWASSEDAKASRQFRRFARCGGAATLITLPIQFSGWPDTVATPASTGMRTLSGSIRDVQGQFSGAMSEEVVRARDYKIE
jgi:hypothetical protein